LYFNGATPVLQGLLEGCRVLTTLYLRSILEVRKALLAGVGRALLK